MGTSFYGESVSGSLKTRLTLGYEHPDFLSFNMGNASAVLGLLGLLEAPNDSQSGECTLPEARRAIMQARARFGRKASSFVREGSDTKQPRRPRVIQGALDEAGLASRLDRFEAFVNVMDRMGADRILWD